MLDNFWSEKSRERTLTAFTVSQHRKPHRGTQYCIPQRRVCKSRREDSCPANQQVQEHVRKRDRYLSLSGKRHPPCLLQIWNQGLRPRLWLQRRGFCRGRRITPRRSSHATFRSG